MMACVERWLACDVSTSWGSSGARKVGGGCSRQCPALPSQIHPIVLDLRAPCLWQAPDTYHVMSPFTHADKIKKPLLLIHGEADNNTGAAGLRLVFD